MMIIEGTQFRLRPFVPEDAESLVKYANNEKIAMHLRDGFPHPYTPDDARKWIDMVMKNASDPIFAIEVEGEAAGGIGLHGMKDIYRFNAEIGYWLAEIHWGKGIVTEAVRKIVDYGFTNYPWTRLYAGVFHTNEASMRVLAKCGFREEAILKRSVKKRGVYLNEHIFSLLKEDYSPAGPET